MLQNVQDKEEEGAWRGGDSHMCFTAGHQLVGSSCSTFTMHFICRHALAGFSVLEEILFSEWH